MIPKLTANGTALMLSAMSGGQLIFTKMQIGAGDTPDNYLGLANLVGPKADINLTSISKEENYVTLSGTISNSTFSEGFIWTELGIYAKIGADGTEQLYAYSHCALDNEQGSYISASSAGLLELMLNMLIFVGDATDITANIADSMVYITKQVFDTHVNDNDNPHAVTKSQVGLGNVPNVTTDDQTPTISTDERAVTDPTTQIQIPSNFQTGDRLATILSKCRAAIAMIGSHFIATNPHKITPETIRAAKQTHSHSTDDITGLTAALTNDYAAKTHSHTVSEVTDIATKYAAKSHNHTVSNITDIADNYAAKTHSHSTDEITELAAFVDGRIRIFFVEDENAPMPSNPQINDLIIIG